MRKKNTAFTLVELLAVISIIAILIALLLPALAAARQYALQVACLSNMHQTYTASIEYANENEGWFPPGDGDVGGIWENPQGYDPYNGVDYAAANSQFNSFRWDTPQIYGPILSPYVGGPADNSLTPGANPMLNFNANDAVMACASILSNPGEAQTLPDGQIDPFQYAFCYGVSAETSHPAPRYGVLTPHDVAGSNVSYYSSSGPGQPFCFMFTCSYPSGNDTMGGIRDDLGWGFQGGRGYSNFGDVDDNGYDMNVMEVDGSAFTVKGMPPGATTGVAPTVALKQDY